MSGSASQIAGHFSPICGRIRARNCCSWDRISGNPWEWNNDGAVPWDLLQYDVHSKLQLFVKELNRLYRSEPALFEVDFHHSGFEWVDFHDADNSVIAFLRRAEDGSFVLFCCNFTPVPREKYRFGVADAGFYQEILNSDSELFGGSNMGNGGLVSTEPIPSHGRPFSVSVTLPPLAVVAFRRRV